MRKKINKVLCAIDLENIRTNMPLPEKFSMTAGLDRIMRQIAEDVGEIINVFVFAPPHLASINAQAFYEEGFYTIYCPKIDDKKGQEEDTVDETMSAFLKDMVLQIPDITHVCIGSGDKDFCQMIRKFILRKGLKIIIVAGDMASLSSELIKLADKNLDGKKMIYLFSPAED